MRLFRHKSLAAQVLSRCGKDVSVACTKSLDGHLSVAHYLKVTANSKKHDHLFCYRNFKPTSYVFNREIKVSGKGTYRRGKRHSELEVKARPDMLLGAFEDHEDVPCGILTRAGPGTITIEVTLTDASKQDTGLGNPVRLVSYLRT